MAQIDLNFFMACTLGDLEWVKDIVKANTGFNIHKDNEYGLSMAAKQGHLKIVKYLIEECGCDLHIEKESILRAVACARQGEVLKYLIQKGADYTVLEHQVYYKERLFCDEILAELNQVKAVIKENTAYKGNIEKLKQHHTVPSARRRPNALKPK